MPPTVFVCGTTGCQGSAVAAALLSRGASVRSVTRDPTSPAAVAAASKGIHLTPGNYDDPEALRAALAGCAAVFLNFMPDFADPGANLRQAKLILATALAAGATHVVYSSGLGVDRIPHILATTGQPPAPESEGGTSSSPMQAILQSKRDIELAVQSANFPAWTVLRPGNFMANYAEPFVRMYQGLTSATGTWTAALPSPEDVVIPLVDTLTIGTWSSEALLDPTRFNARTIPYADEKLPLGTIFRKLRRATGKDLRLVAMATDEVEARRSDPFVAGQRAMALMDGLIDMDEPRGWGLPASSFDAFLAREKDALDKTYANVPAIQ
ncbi:hypothetical protein N3K66_000753 [Trichothecium roseum]|uniref:Uncharacterized protein n=1 Tax=Trichothecium roseum TaxID=47278 RepID=A0ACC0VCU4_9HYPO|nr:hypothetical protein N3K66_000753 [Trichothecium roseum]